MAEETCKYEAPDYSLNPGRRCGQPPLPDDPHGYCMFHSRNADKNAPAFERALDLKADFNFAGYVFPVEADFYGRTLQEADFTDARFLKAAQFTAARFEGAANFWGARFAADANFWGARFAADANFREARFAAGAHFGWATFAAAADFREARFAAEAYFGGASFAAAADFGGARFAAWADFWGASFAAANFREARFAAEAYFWGATFAGDTLFEGPREGTTFGRGSSFAGADVGKLTFRNLSLGNVSFRDGVGLEKAEFDNVTWGTDALRLWKWHWPGWIWSFWPFRALGLFEPRRGVIEDELDARAKNPTWEWPKWLLRAWWRSRRRPGVEQTLKAREERLKQGRDACAAAERVYRGLIRSYRERGDYEPTRHFDYNRMEMRRLRTFEFALTLYGALSGYGLRWGLPVVWLLLVLPVFALLYGATGLQTVDGTFVVPQMAFSFTDVSGSSILDCFAYSLRSALLQPEREIRPATEWGRVAQAIEMVLGPLLIALLALALRRKFQR